MYICDAAHKIFRFAVFFNMPSDVITSSVLESAAIGFGTIEAGEIVKGTLPFEQCTAPGTTTPSTSSLIIVGVLNTLLASFDFRFFVGFS